MRAMSSPGAIQQPWCPVLRLYFLKFDPCIKKKTKQRTHGKTQVVQMKASVTKISVTKILKISVLPHFRNTPSGKNVLGSGSTSAHQLSQRPDVFKKSPAPVSQAARGRGAPQLSNKCLALRKRSCSKQAAKRDYNNILRTMLCPGLVNGSARNREGKRAITRAWDT